MRKPAPPRDIPPPLELECLKALWRLGEGSVKDVREAMTENRRLAYTTVMTVLDRLERRKAVTRRKAGRAFIYAPLKAREALRQIAVKELVDCFFDGDRESLLDYLRSGKSEAPPGASEAAASLDTTLL